MATRKSSGAKSKQTPSAEASAIHFPIRGGVDGAQELRTVLLSRLETSKLQDLEIDCSQAEHLDAAILQVLCAGALSWKAHSKEILLKGITPSFQDQLARTGADEYLQVRS